MRKSIVQEKSFSFAQKVYLFYKKLIKEKEFILSKQILRSGTSVGANIEEALYANSKKDFLYKLRIAYKENQETRYWLKILESYYTLPKNIIKECEEISKILSAIIITTKKNLLKDSPKVNNHHF